MYSSIMLLVFLAAHVPYVIAWLQQGNESHLPPMMTSRCGNTILRTSPETVRMMREVMLNTGAGVPSTKKILSCCPWCNRKRNFFPSATRDPSNSSPNPLTMWTHDPETQRQIDNNDFDLNLGPWIHCNHQQTSDGAIPIAHPLDLASRIRFDELPPFQVTHCISGYRGITYKIEMCKLSRIVGVNGVFAPECFLIPNDVDELGEAWNRSSIWVLKEDGSLKHRGQGITFLHEPWTPKLQEFFKSVSGIVQSYVMPFVAPPFHRRVELRWYILVTSVTPLRAYMLDDGWVSHAHEAFLDPPDYFNILQDEGTDSGASATSRAHFGDAIIRSASMRYKNLCHADDVGVSRDFLTAPQKQLSGINWMKRAKFSDASKKGILEGVRKTLTAGLLVGLKTMLTDTRQMQADTHGAGSRCFLYLRADMAVVPKSWKQRGVRAYGSDISSIDEPEFDVKIIEMNEHPYEDHAVMHIADELLRGWGDAADMLQLKQPPLKYGNSWSKYRTEIVQLQQTVVQWCVNFTRTYGGNPRCEARDAINIIRQEFEQRVSRYMTPLYPPNNLEKATIFEDGNYNDVAATSKNGVVTRIEKELTFLRKIMPEHLIRFDQLVLNWLRDKAQGKVHV